MDELESLSHTRRDCKYHVVSIPKCRRKTLYCELRRHLGGVFRRLAGQKKCRIEEGHLMPDHVQFVAKQKHRMVPPDPLDSVQESWPGGDPLSRPDGDASP